MSDVLDVLDVFDIFGTVKICTVGFRRDAWVDFGTVEFSNFPKNIVALQVEIFFLESNFPKYLAL